MAFYAIDKKSYVGLAIQAAKGTAATPDNTLWLTGAPSMNLRQQAVGNTAADGNFYQTQMILTDQWPEGGVDFAVRPDDLALLGTAIFQHSDACDQTPYITYSADIGKVLNVEVSDCRVATAGFGFTLAQGFGVTARLGLQGLTYSQGTSLASSFSILTTKPFNRSAVSVTIDGTAADAFVRDLNLDLSWNVPAATEMGEFGSLNPVDVINTEMTATGNLTLRLKSDDLAFAQAITNGSAVPLQVVVDRGASEASGTFIVPGAFFESFSPNPAGQRTSLIDVPLSFTCLGDSSNTPVDMIVTAAV